jgi:hypothetical protein
LFVEIRSVLNLLGSCAEVGDILGSLATMDLTHLAISLRNALNP